MSELKVEDLDLESRCRLVANGRAQSSSKLEVVCFYLRVGAKRVGTFAFWIKVAKRHSKKLVELSPPTLPDIAVRGRLPGLL